MHARRCPVPLAALTFAVLALAGCGASEHPEGDDGRAGKGDVPYTGRDCYDRSSRGEPWQDYSMHRCVDTAAAGFAGSACDGHTVKGYCHGGANIRCCVPPAPTCGDGKREGSEACDGSDLGGATCASLGHAGGTLACGAGCTLDTAGCSGAPAGGAFGDRCGGSFGECSPGLMCIVVNNSGSDEGFCTQKCSQTAPCPGTPPGADCLFTLTATGDKICGFRCDAADPQCPGGMTCTEIGGFFACTTDDPPVCNDGEIEGSEECDGAALNNMSCASFGYASGTLKCGSDCTFDKSDCEGAIGCDLPPLDCTAGDAACGELELLAPAQGAGYVMGHHPEWSWGRHDVFMTMKHAAAAVDCLMPGSLPIHTFDVSMQDGSIPKNDAYYNPCDRVSASCRLRHPEGTHVDGRDIDMSYYQTQGMANPGAVCPHTISGREAYHCVGAPTILDAPRTALYLGRLFESSRIRVVGVDGQIGPLLTVEAQKLLQQGLLTSTAYSRLKSRMAYETTDVGRGWYLHHHHHFHVSHVTGAYPSPMMPDDGDGWVTPAVDTGDGAHDLSILDPVVCAKQRCADLSEVPLIELGALSPGPGAIPISSSVTVRRLE